MQPPLLLKLFRGIQVHDEDGIVSFCSMAVGGFIADAGGRIPALRNTRSSPMPKAKGSPRGRPGLRFETNVYRSQPHP